MIRAGWCIPVFALRDPTVRGTVKNKSRSCPDGHVRYRTFSCGYVAYDEEEAQDLRNDGWQMSLIWIAMLRDRYLIPRIASFNFVARDFVL
jgi:hypothetical protein